MGHIKVRRQHLKTMQMPYVQPPTILHSAAPPSYLPSANPQESDERGATILYATHIFDGLEGWISHIAYMEDGAMVKGGDIASVREVAELAAQASAAPGKAPRKLLHVVEDWLRSERDARHARAAAAGTTAADLETAVKPQRTPFMPSKHLAFFR